MNLLLLALVLTAAIVLIKISSKSGIPELLLFTVLGMAFSFLGFEFNDFQFADSFASVALMVIMFHGGFGTNWSMAKPVAKESIVLSFFGTIATGLVTGFFAYKLLGFDFLDGMLIGAILGSTDYSSVSNILRARNLNLKYNTSPLLEVESGSNDPTAYTMTMVFIAMYLGQDVSVPIMIVQQMGFGILIGFLMAYISGKIIDAVRFEEDGLFIIFIICLALLTYGINDVIGGNGYLALYILGISLGNREFKGKRDVVFFFDGFSQLMHIGLFFMLGLLSNPQAFISNLPTSIIIMVFMMFIARPISVFVLMLPFKMPKEQLALISLAGIRGAAAIAFAIMAVNANLGAPIDIYHIVFGICVISSLVQGYLMAPAARKLDMLDPSDTVLKTFNDYQDKSDIGFIQTVITEESRWVGRPVSEIRMAFDVIVATIERDGKNITPRGTTVMHEGDVIVLGGETHFDTTGHELVEFVVNESHPWANQKVQDINIKEDELVIMLQRSDGGIIVPKGETTIYPGDTLVTIKE